MKLADVIVAISFNRPVWENILKIIFFLWFALMNGIAVYGMSLVFKDRKMVLAETGVSSKEAFKSIFAVLCFVFFIIVTLLFIAGVVVAFVDIF